MGELSKFFNEHQFLSTVFVVAGAFTLYETISAVKAPKGEGPFSGLGASTSTTSSTSSSHAMM